MKLAIAMFATMFWFLLAMCLGFIGLVARNTWLQGQLVAYRALTGQPAEETAEISCIQRLLCCLKCCCCCKAQRPPANEDPEGQPGEPEQQDQQEPPEQQDQQEPPEQQQAAAVTDQQAAAMPDQQAAVAAPTQQDRQQPSGLSQPLEPTRLGPPASAHQGPPAGERQPDGSGFQAASMHGMPPFFPLARNNSFRRKQQTTPAQDQDDYREWVQETARMLQLMTKMNAARKQSSDYDNLGDSMLTLDEAGTGWKFRPAPPRPRQPSFDTRELPPLPRHRPPTPERTSSVPRKAKASKAKGGQQQLPPFGENDLSSAFRTKYNLWPEDYE